MQDGGVKENNPTLAEKLKIELALLYDILGDDVPEEYWAQIETEAEGSDYEYTE